MKAFIDALTDEEAAAVVAGMKEVADFGLERARHLRGEIYEVRVSADRRIFRLLFAQETKLFCYPCQAFRRGRRRRRQGS